MPSKHNRNANRLHKQSPIYPSSLLSQVDNHSPATSPNPSPLVQVFEPSSFDSSPVPEVPLLTLDDMESNTDYAGPSERVRGDEESDEAPATLMSPPLSEPSSNRSIAAKHAQMQEHRNDHLSGHTRSPVLTREPTMLENFSRTVRNYVPSSIPIPTAAPSPPRVSRPVSFGSFMTSSNATKRRGSSAGNRDTEGLAWGRGGGLVEIDEAVFGSDDEDEGNVESIRGVTSYPGAGEGEPILWARWDSIGMDMERPRRILILRYPTGLQVWDCTNIGSVFEILNLHGSEWGRTTYAGILPRPTSPEGDQYSGQRPLLGITRSGRDGTFFVAYSLRQHTIVKRLGFPGLVSFASNGHFIVFSTVDPPTLHIISSTSFSTLFTIPSSSLVPYTISSSSSKNNNNANISVLLPGLESDSRESPPQLSSQPQPVYALSGRLLAYASPSPRPDSPTGMSATQPRTHTRSTSGGFSLSQADLGNAAIKVGGSVLSGMKSLGGMAYSAARSRASGVVASPGDQGSDVKTGGPAPSMGGLTNLFFSRSAPAASVGEHGRRQSVTSFVSGTGFNDAHEPEAGSPSSPRGVSQSPSYTTPTAGHFITVVDLDALLSGSSTPTTLSEFVVSKHQPISSLKFTSDGTSLIVAPKDGQVMRYFQVRPSPKAPSFDSVQERGSRGGSESSKAPSDDHTINAISGDAPWHMYNLRRGRTSAVVEGIAHAQDGRWVAVGTRKRTIHVFPVNPYGGKPDQRSHLDGRVRNFTELPLSTEVTPIVRLRAAKFAPTDRPRAPLAFVFIKSSDASLPSSLLPPATPHSTSHSSARSSPARQPEPLSPHRLQRPTNFQDLLVFDPVDGVLSLKRFFVELCTHDQGLSVPPSTHTIGGTSISLPGMSSAGRLSISPPTLNGRVVGKSAGPKQTAETPSELYGKESIVATWGLKRRQDWAEIKHVIRYPVAQNKRESLANVNTLAQAELSTCSRLTRVLPRPIYLSHQFSFHALGEDYHALIRSYQFDIGGSKLEVRKEVEVSAYSTGIGESFVEGFSSPRDVRHVSSSFDEPLASAISAGLDYQPTPTVLPMLPNGMPRSHPKSFRNPIPIRTMASGLSDGMSESLGRLRREVHKARSPQTGSRSDNNISGSVPLEFDEEDEDFFAHDDDKPNGHDDDTTSRTTSRGEGDSGASISTPSTNAAPLDEGDDTWNGWGAEDMQAVDDAERFDDISVVGFLDEEHAQMVQAERAKAKTRGKRQM